MTDSADTTMTDPSSTFKISMAEAAAAQILDSLTPTELATLEAAWHATGDVQTAMQETLKGAQP